MTDSSAPVNPTAACGNATAVSGEMALTLLSAIVQKMLATPGREALAQLLAIERPPSGPSLIEVAREWEVVRRAKWSLKTRKEFPRIVAHFIAFAAARGKKTLADVDRSLVAQYLEALDGKDGGVSGHRLGKNTQNKYLAALTSLFNEAAKDGRRDGPVVSMKGFQHSDVTSTSYSALSDAEVTLLFEPAAYVRWSRRSPALFWIPLTALHTGMRINECAQLRTDDVKQIDGTHCLRVTDMQQGQRLKNRTSRRTVPLHPELVGLGFHDYVAAVLKVFGDGPLFPWLNQSVNGVGSAPGKAWSRFMSARLEDPTKRGHSLRHTVNVRMNRDKVSDGARCALLGHAHGTVNTGVYCDWKNPSHLAALTLPHIKFPLNYASLGRCDYDGWVAVLRHLKDRMGAAAARSRNRALRASRERRPTRASKGSTTISS